MQARAHYQSKATHEAAKTYNKNIERIISMSMVPGAAFVMVNCGGNDAKKRCET
jgi:hypothetical protein